jgi:hypothetical protein
MTGKHTWSKAEKEDPRGVSLYSRYPENECRVYAMLG